jgi:hypothetical protein
MQVRNTHRSKTVHITLPMYVMTITKEIKIILSSFTTYNSCEIAAAIRPVPRRAVPVFVMRLEDGNFSISSSARLEGGTGLVVIERLL